MLEVDTIYVENSSIFPQMGDVVRVFNNGGFGGIHGNLIERLKFRKWDTPHDHAWRGRSEDADHWARVQ